MLKYRWASSKQLNGEKEAWTARPDTNVENRQNNDKIRSKDKFVDALSEIDRVSALYYKNILFLIECKEVKLIDNLSSNSVLVVEMIFKHEY